MPASRFIPASDRAFCFEGRFDAKNQHAPTVVWQGSRISLDFEGSFLQVRFGPALEQNVFDLSVDDRTEIVAVPAGEIWNFCWPHALDSGRHHLRLFKRSEAAAGQVGFAGVEIAAEARTWRPSFEKYRLRMEFFGDSITVGACNEDGEIDQWEDRRTHNHALSYVALTAAAFHADHRCIAVSGMGIAAGYVEVTAGEVWNKIYPRADSPLADLNSWQPDLAFLNFGENDDSFSRSMNQSFPGDFTAKYLALFTAMRTAYPHTHFVLLRGGMFGGAKSEELRAAWEAVVRDIEAKDDAVSHFVFRHWSSNHPRVSDHRIMADELIAWLKQRAFMTRFL